MALRHYEGDVLMKVGPAFFGSISLPVVTLNPSDKHADISLTSGNLIATKVNADALRSVRATRGIDHTENGYFEVLFIEGAQIAPFALVGVSTTSLATTGFVGGDANGWGYYQDTGEKYTNNTPTAYGTAYETDGDVIGVAFANGKVWFAKNGTWQNSGDPAAGTGEAFSGITGTIYPTISLYNAAPTAHQVRARFKTADFTQTVPSGFSPWGA